MAIRLSAERVGGMNQRERAGTRINVHLDIRSSRCQVIRHLILLWLYGYGRGYNNWQQRGFVTVSLGKATIAGGETGRASFNILAEIRPIILVQVISFVSTYNKILPDSLQGSRMWRCTALTLHPAPSPAVPSPPVLLLQGEVAFALPQLWLQHDLGVLEVFL